MALDSTKLQPYASFLLYVWTKKAASRVDRDSRLDTLLQHLKTAIVKGTVSFVDDGPLTGVGAVAGVALHVKKSSQAPWTTDTAVQDVDHHLIVMAEFDGTMGAAVSDAQLRAEVEAVLDAYPGLTAVNSSVLEGSLMRSEIRTLWLRGAHRKTYYKADSKVLTGPRLESALNPLDDRTFTPSSARAGTGLPQSDAMPVVGVSPDRSYVWIGPTKSAVDFCRRFRLLLNLIAAGTTKPAAPLPILSRTLPHVPLPATVTQAFDFDFASVDTAPDLSADDRRLLEEAQDRLRIETVGQPDQDFKLLVTDLDHPNAVRTDKAWQIEVAIALTTGRTKAALSADSAGWPRWTDFRELFAKRTLWSVWYDSRHSLTAGKWALVDQRASSFDGDFTGVQFVNGGWTVHEEKPLNGKAVDWGKIGKELSLFSWWIKKGMAECFPDFVATAEKGAFAYAICDDGSNELGDFIVLAKHSSFATGNNPSELALIMVHMKAASDSAVRQMAPKRYEEVLGQAMKNLGRVKFDEVRDYFLKTAEDGGAPFWKWSKAKFQTLLARGAKAPKGSQMHTDLTVFDGRRTHVHVVVVQPHQDVDEFKLAMNQPTVDFKTRMLCTLLCAAEGAARASSAKLKVVMSAK